MRRFCQILLAVTCGISFVTRAEAQSKLQESPWELREDQGGDLKATVSSATRPVQHANARSDVHTERSAARPAAFQPGNSAFRDPFSHSSQTGGQFYPAPAPYGMNPDSSYSPGGYSHLFGGTAEPLYHTYGAVQGKVGNNRVLGDIQLMVPLWQNSDTLFFADMRGQMDDHDSSEGNWGLGLRSIMDTGWILGAYGFYDHRETTFDHHVQQATFGMEALAVEWEARVNGYVSEGLAGRVAAFNTAEIANGTMVLRLGQERAYSGVDAEVGVLITDWDDGAIELRGFAGGFHFSTDAPGFRDISGPRFRAELRSYDLAMLGEGSRVTLGAEYSWDQIRDDQVFAVAHVQVPLGPGSSRRLTRLERRMLDRVVRDVDIVSHATGGDAEQAINPSTGEAFGRVEFVDATGDLQAAILNAGIDGTIIAGGDAGQFDSDSTITLLDGQSLFGGGTTFEVTGATSGAAATFTAGGSAPVINQSDSSLDVLALSNDNTITGTVLQGGRNAIAGNNATGFRISNNTLRDTSESGIRILADSTNQISGRIEGNTIEDSEGASITIDARDQADINLSDAIVGNRLNRSAGDGVFIHAAGASTVRAGLKNNIVNDAGTTGFTLRSTDTAKLFADAVDNRITAAVADGVYFHSADDSVSTVTLRRNEIQGDAGTTADGIDVNSEGNAFVTLTIVENEITDVDNRGIFTRAFDGGLISLADDLYNNTFIGDSIDEDYALEMTTGGRFIQSVQYYTDSASNTE